MASLNKVQLIGNLGADPEVRHTGDGRAIANLNIATTESWKDKQGEKQEKTEWHRVVIFGPLAEVAEKWLKKGASVYLEGKLQTRKWQDESGNDRYSTEVVVDQRGILQMLGGKDAPAEDNYAKAKEGTTPKPAQVTEDEPFDDDVPF